MIKFNEIDSLLDQIKGGKTETALFGNYADPNGIRVCNELCTDICKDMGVGNTTGTIQGTIRPN